MKIRLIDVKAFAERHDLHLVRRGYKACGYYYEMYINGHDDEYVGVYWSDSRVVRYYPSTYHNNANEYNTREELNNA